MPGHRLGKKHRMSIRWVNRGENLLTSELDTDFRPCLPAVRAVMFFNLFLRILVFCELSPVFVDTGRHLSL